MGPSAAMFAPRQMSEKPWGTKANCVHGSWGKLWTKRYKETENLTATSEVQFSSVAQLCPILCNPEDHSTPSFPVHHQLPELAQTHVHQVGDAILAISSSVVHFFSCLQSFPASGSFQRSQSFASGGQWPKYWSFSFNISPSNEYSWLNIQHQSFQWIFRTDFHLDGLVGSPCSPRDSRESSPTPQFKSISSLVLSFLNSPTLTSIHDYWKTHSFD